MPDIYGFFDKWGELMIQNPIPFIIFTVAVAGLTWKISQWVNSAHLSALSAQISTLKERLSLAEDKARGGSEGIKATKPLITSDQYGQVVRYLQGQDPIYVTESGTRRARYVCVQIPANSNENEATAYRLKNAIESAGWKSNFELRIPEERYSQGIWILGPSPEPGKPPTSRAILKAALASAGIQFKDEEEHGIGYYEPAVTFVVLGRGEAL